MGMNVRLRRWSVQINGFTKEEKYNLKFIISDKPGAKYGFRSEQLFIRSQPLKSTKVN